MSISSVKTYRMLIRNPYFDQIKKCTKTVEGRVNSLFYKAINPGDHIIFKYKEKSIACEVTQVNFYKSFRVMLENKGFKNCVPSASNLDAAVKIYLKLPGYAQKERIYGVLAFDVKPIASYPINNETACYYNSSQNRLDFIVS